MLKTILKIAIVAIFAGLFASGCSVSNFGSQLGTEVTPKNTFTKNGKDYKLKAGGRFGGQLRAVEVKRLKARVDTVAGLIKKAPEAESITYGEQVSFECGSRKVSFELNKEGNTGNCYLVFSGKSMQECLASTAKSCRVWAAYYRSSNGYEAGTWSLVPVDKKGDKLVYRPWSKKVQKNGPACEDWRSTPEKGMFNNFGKIVNTCEA